MFVERFGLRQLLIFLNERERESWEFENCFEGEKKEMIEIY